MLSEVEGRYSLYEVNPHFLARGKDSEPTEIFGVYSVKTQGGSLNVRNEPDDFQNSKVISSLPNGSMIVVAGESSQSFRVLLWSDSGEIIEDAWVSKKYVARLGDGSWQNDFLVRSLAFPYEGLRSDADELPRVTAPEFKT